MYVIAEYYQSGKSVAEHAAAIKSLAAKLGWKTDGKGRLCALIDSAANQRTLAASRSVSELFYDEGVLVNAKVDKDVFSGISRVKEYLRPTDCPDKPKLVIFSCCKNLIREMKGYAWGEGESPIKRNDHALDALRYFIASKPEPYVPPAPAKTPLERDKLRLMRRLRFGRRR